MRFRSFPIDLGELLNLWASVYSRASIELLIEVDQLGEQPVA